MMTDNDGNDAIPGDRYGNGNDDGSKGSKSVDDSSSSDEDVVIASARNLNQQIRETLEKNRIQVRELRQRKAKRIQDLEKVVSELREAKQQQQQQREQQEQLAVFASNATATGTGTATSVTTRRKTLDATKDQGTRARAKRAKVGKKRASSPEVEEKKAAVPQLVTKDDEETQGAVFVEKKKMMMKKRRSQRIRAKAPAANNDEEKEDGAGSACSSPPTKKQKETPLVAAPAAAVVSPVAAAAATTNATKEDAAAVAMQGTPAAAAAAAIVSPPRAAASAPSPRAGRFPRRAKKRAHYYSNQQKKKRPKNTKTPPSSIDQRQSSKTIDPRHLFGLTKGSNQRLRKKSERIDAVLFDDDDDESSSASSPRESNNVIANDEAPVLHFRNKEHTSNKRRIIISRGEDMMRRLRIKQYKVPEAELCSIYAEGLAPRDVVDAIVSADGDGHGGGDGLLSSKMGQRRKAELRGYVQERVYGMVQAMINISAVGGGGAAVPSSKSEEESRCEELCGILLTLTHQDRRMGLFLASYCRGIPALVAAMNAYPRNANLQINAIGTLHNLVTDLLQNHEAIVLAGGIDAIVRAMRNHSTHLTLQTLAACAMWRLALRRSPRRRTSSGSGGSRSKTNGGHSECGTTVVKAIIAARGDATLLEALDRLGRYDSDLSRCAGWALDEIQ